MKRIYCRLGIIAAVVLAVVTLQANAAPPRVVVISTDSSSSVDTGEVIIGGPAVFTLCGGTGGNTFSGSFVIKQGLVSGQLATTYSSGSLSGISACDPSTNIQIPTEMPYLQIVVTRSSGTYSSSYYWTPRATK